MKENVVIWGAGRLLVNQKQYINWDEVLCVLDNNSEKHGKIIEGKVIISPTEISKLKFEKVVVFVSGYFDDIYLRLTTELGVESEKILYWCDYLNVYSVQQTLEQIIEDVYHKGCTKLLDLKKNFWNNHVYVYPDEQVSIEVVNYEGDYALCRSVYGPIEKCNPKAQSAVFLGRITDEEQPEWEKWFVQYKVIYFTIAYSDVALTDNCLPHILNASVTYERFDLKYERLCCVSKKKQDKELRIFIAAHKGFAPPQSEMYVPLWLGKSENNIWGYQEDKDDPNISGLNSLINECTGIFWIWKHAEADYVGLVHYRRYFLNDTKEDIDNILGREKALRLLETYDVITAPLQFFPHSVANQLQETTFSDAYEQGMSIIKDVISRKQPDYLEAFQYVFAGNTMFPCNMIITSKELFDKYSEWLFSIIIEATEMVNVSAYDAYSKRIIGFMAERLLTVWLIKQELKIKELPILLTE